MNIKNLINLTNSDLNELIKTYLNIKNCETVDSNCFKS